MRPETNVSPSDWEPATAVRDRNIALTRALPELLGTRGRVLEVGAGTARFLRAICRQLPGLEGHACDMARAGLVVARQDDHRLATAQAELTALPYRDETFDTVLVFDVLEHLREPDRGLGELWRVLVPGGTLHGLVPCEGQPLTLHWLLWRLDIAADLKERRVGHVQRFTHSSVRKLLDSRGFVLRRATYSMHPLGQVKDILSYLEQEPGFPSWLRRNPLFRALGTGLWAGAYVESSLLRPVSWGAVALHVTATKVSR